MTLRLSKLRALTLRASPGGPAHVSAASGLARVGDSLCVIADDELHLGVFPANGDAPGELLRLRAGELPEEHEARKRAKPDFESLARLPLGLLALGSCSTPERCAGVVMELGGGSLHALSPVDAAPLREAMERRYGRLNIEGAYVLGDELHLLQRANKGDRRNARIRLRLDEVLRGIGMRRVLDARGLLGIEEIDLGEVEGIPLCFTDGSPLGDGRAVFTAVAEDTADSYADGPCRGAAIGIIGRDGRLEALAPIDRCHKVEGIDAMLDGNVIRALLVTDADDRSVPASLLACEFQPRR